jgi:hypothetical protein
MLSPDAPGLILPGQLHWVEPQGPMRMQVDFYNEHPDPDRPAWALEG